MDFAFDNSNSVTLKLDDSWNTSRFVGEIECILKFESNCLINTLIITKSNKKFLEVLNNNDRIDPKAKMISDIFDFFYKL